MRNHMINNIKIVMEFAAVVGPQRYEKHREQILLIQNP
jgi:hypothetical protein